MTFLLFFWTGNVITHSDFPWEQQLLVVSHVQKPLGTKEGTYRATCSCSQHGWALLCMSDPADTLNLDRRGHCSPHGIMEERKSQWPSRPRSLSHIRTAHLTHEGVPGCSSWAYWEWGCCAICAPAVLPGANLVCSHCERVIGRSQLCSEISTFGLLQHKERVKMFHNWQEGFWDTIPVLCGSSEHMRNEPTMVKSVIHGHGRLGLSWWCEGVVMGR